MRARTILRLGSLNTIASLWCLVFPSTSYSGVAPPAPLTSDQVVDRMVVMNRARAEALRGYTSTCIYHIENDNQNKSADMIVKIVFVWPNQKESTIISASGSDLLRRRVLSRLMEGEAEAMQAENRRRADLNPENYDFRLLDYRSNGERSFYVLEVTPKNKNKFLFQGQIWVSADDFGIVRMQGAPAKNPSWWTTHIDLLRSYCKVGDFWLPARNETVAQVRLFGRSVLTIEYKDYKLIEARSIRVPILASAIPFATRLAAN
jgi:hypothetical protein